MSEPFVLARHPHRFPTEPHGTSVTIGNFDGLHLGHQALIHQALASEHTATVVTFEPLPREYFHLGGDLPRLTTLREKVAIIADMGVRRVLCLHFNQRLAAFTAEAFLQRILLDGLNMRHLTIGEDFRFGRDRGGDVNQLQEWGQRYGFGVTVVAPVRLLGERISSTSLRKLLSEDRLDQVKAWLGRPYAICGKVVHGNKQGRQFGFPTANIDLSQRSSPLHGVYTVLAQTRQGEQYTGVANIGTRPTIAGVPKRMLEIHCLNGNPNLYGQRLQVAFLHKLRDEQRFAGLDALRAQIQADVAEARTYFQNLDTR